MVSTKDNTKKRGIYYTAFSLLIVASLIYFIVEYVVAAAWPAPGYSYGNNYVSDLGVPLCGITNRLVCSPLYMLMNSAFVVVGGLSLVGMLTFASLFTGIKKWIIAVMAVIQSVGIMLVGVAPGSFAEDITNDRVQMALHSLGAVFGILGTAVLAILVGVFVIKRSRIFGLLSLLLGAIPLVSLLLQAVTHIENLGLGRGGFERLGVYSIVLWLGVVGVWGVLHVGAKKGSIVD